MYRILKIVYCNPALHVSGGGERVLTVKANYFAEKLGYEIHIVTTDGGKYPPFFTLHPSVKVHQLNINYDDYFSPCRRVWEFFHKRYLHKKRLNRCLNKIKPDITVIMTRREVGFIASMTDGSVKIAENHVDKSRYMDSMNPHLSKFLPMWLKRRYRENIIASLSKLDKFILLTHEDEKAWTELHNLAVIPNPLTIIPDGVSRCENKRVIAVGRYEHQKGFDLLLKAWKEVANTHKDWTMHIYGEGILRENLQKQLISLGLEDSCFLEHHTLQIGECFKTSSLFVLSSRFEGWGLVIVEAMAYGLPVVSFACPCGPKEIIVDGVDGFLVEPQNIKELACKISYVIENEEIRKTMGYQASVNVHRYDIERIVPRWVQLFEELTI